MNTVHAQIAKRLPPFLYKLAAQAWIDRDYPRHIFLETTASCNLTCSYCPRERRGDHMDFALFTRIVDEATQYGKRSFSLHLFGEPLLYHRIHDSIKYLKDRGHTVLLTTNGTRLHDHLDRLIGGGVDQVLWSWRPEVQFSPVLKEKLRSWGRFRVRFIEEVTPPEARIEWADWANVEGRKLHNYGGNINIPTLGDSNQQPAIAEKRWPCYHLWLAPAVAWNGQILLCCADPHRKEVLGKFPEQSVGEVWRGDRLAAIRSSHLRGEYGGICSGCDVWKSYPDIFFKWQRR